VRPAGGGSLTEPAASSTALARTSLAGLLRDAAKLDRTQSDPVVSLRNAVGVGIPLVVGTLSGAASLGLSSTVGALQTAFADRPGPYRLRILRMLGTAVAAAVTSTLAVTASAHAVASVLLLLVLAFVAGLLTAGGPSATQVGTAGVAAALVLGHLRASPSVALHVGLLVLAGGAVQTVLAVAAWPLGRHKPERLALAKLYRELATAARTQRGTSVGPPAGETLTTVRQTLYGLGHDHGPSVEAYRVLLDEGERIRRELVVLNAAAERLADERHPILAGLVRGSSTAAASVLDEVAAALDGGRPVRAEVLDPARDAFRHAVTRLEEATDPSAELTRRAAVARLRALSGQLRAAIESARTGAGEGRGGEEPAQRGLDLVREPIAILRANLTVNSAVFRHAVRLAVLVAGSDAVVRAIGFDRGYWVGLTALVVLRPDFATTWQRSVLRVIGTFVGLVLATVLVHWVPGGDWWQVALILAFAFGMRFAGPGNIGLTAVCLSGLVVVLLEVNGVSAHTTVISRAVATVAGGGLALLAATALLPSWERRFVRTRLAELLDAYHAYVQAVADPDTSRAALQRARAACRVARSNAQASLDRARAEPVRGQEEVELGRGVLSHSHRFIHAMLSLDSVRPSVRDAGGLRVLSAFLGAAAAALTAARCAIADGRPPRPVPTLRPLQEEAAATFIADPDRAGGWDAASTVVDATDRITNSLDTLLDEVRRQFAVASAP
jgi:uncharacterized membrane protein YccC